MSTCTVYVTGMPASVTEDDVFDFFARIGNVAEVHMPSTEQQAASGAVSAVEVVFDRPEDAVSAVSISGSDFQEDTPIYISAVPPSVAAPGDSADPATPAAGDTANNGSVNAAASEASAELGAGLLTRRPAEAEKTSKNKVVVSSIYPHTTRSQVRDVFAACGEICDFHLIPNRHIAFVGYTTEEAYEKALKLDGVHVNGSSIVVRPCPPRDGAHSPRRDVVTRRGSDGAAAAGPNKRSLDVRVVVHGVPSDVSKEALRAFFSPDCGPLVDVFLKPDIGVAFVAFTTPENAKRAIAKSGEVFMGACVRVEQRLPLICRRCDKEGHVAAQCREHPRGTQHRIGDRHRRRRSSSSSSHRGRRRRHRSDSLDRDRRRHRSDSLDRDRRRRHSDSPDRDRDRDRRRHSRSRSPPRRRRHSRSPPRARR